MIQKLRPLGAYGMGKVGDLISDMAAAITQMEGVNPNFVGNNNDTIYYDYIRVSQLTKYLSNYLNYLYY